MILTPVDAMIYATRLMRSQTRLYISAVKEPFEMSPIGFLMHFSDCVMFKAYRINHFWRF